MEMMKAVSFMYVRPPGYNPESAKAAEIADKARDQGQGHGSTSQDTSAAGASTSGRPEVPPDQEKKKPRAKDIYGRPLPTEEEFEVLKNAPRLETGVVGRAKPFGIEIRNVKCVRCGTFGHQSGDRECPLKDAIMPNEESRIKRDDPLTAILAQTDASEPLKWELKQKPGISPPRGGFELDDPNQQIVAEDIFDEYGGFLTGDNVPDLLASLSSKPKKKKKSSKSKNRKRSSPARADLRDDKEISSSSDDDGGRSLKKKKHKKSLKQSKSFDDSDGHQRRSNRQRHPRSSWGKHSESSSEDNNNDRYQRSNRHKRSRSSSPSLKIRNTGRRRITTIIMTQRTMIMTCIRKGIIDGNGHGQVHPSPKRRITGRRMITTIIMTQRTMIVGGIRKGVTDREVHPSLKRRITGRRIITTIITTQRMIIMTGIRKE
uniref:Putative ovule protein n=1 Tax=Solanum chacoense TaxID=4108 RepID=A0A0V0ILU3_SOLCH